MSTENMCPEDDASVCVCDNALWLNSVNQETTTYDERKQTPATASDVSNAAAAVTSTLTSRVVTSCQDASAQAEAVEQQTVRYSSEWHVLCISSINNSTWITRANHTNCSQSALSCVMCCPTVRVTRACHLRLKNIIEFKFLIEAPHGSVTRDVHVYVQFQLHFCSSSEIADPCTTSSSSSCSLPLSSNVATSTSTSPVNISSPKRLLGLPPLLLPFNFSSKYVQLCTDILNPDHVPKYWSFLLFSGSEVTLCNSRQDRSNGIWALHVIDPSAEFFGKSWLAFKKCGSIFS